MPEPKYNEKGQVRVAYIEETAGQAEKLIDQLVALDNEWIWLKDEDRLKRWMR